MIVPCKEDVAILKALNIICSNLHNNRRVEDLDTFWMLDGLANVCIWYFLVLVVLIMLVECGIQRLGHSGIIIITIPRVSL